MSTQLANGPLHMSANDQFKAKYNKTLRWSALIAVVLTLIGFLVSPNYTPHPYKLKQQEMEVVNLDDQEVIDIPPPPVEAPPPPKVIEAAPDDEVADDVDISDTLIDLDTAISNAMPVYDTGQGDGFVASSENPKIISWAKPHYPEMARRAQIEGTVLVKVLVGPDGSVKEAVLVRGVNPLVDKEALKAARKCRFIPGKQRNIPVKAWMALPFVFRLN